ncbi:hypothetical protein [Kineococcus sp. SYSU DK001]|uniref:hypothetical protein n=1 Tax=Kineococcus sp. SYSU DK001 TaxID=3383122 RepID=UPI003D7EBCD4
MWAATVLPERVPTHFGPGGEAGAWGWAAGAVTSLAVLTAGPVGTFSALARWVPRARWEWVDVPREQEWVDVPREQEWVDAGLGGRAAPAVAHRPAGVGTGMDVFAGSLTVAVVQAARSAGHGLPGWWSAVLAGWLVFTAGHVVVTCAVRYRPPAGVRAS